MANKGGYGMSNEYGTPKKGTGVRMMGQVNELWGQVEEIRRYKGRRGGGGEREGWLADEKVLGEIAEVSRLDQPYRIRRITADVQRYWRLSRWRYRS